MAWGTTEDLKVKWLGRNFEMLDNEIVFCPILEKHGRPLKPLMGIFGTAEVDKEIAPFELLWAYNWTDVLAYCLMLILGWVILSLYAYRDWETFMAKPEVLTEDAKATWKDIGVLNMALNYIW